MNDSRLKKQGHREGKAEKKRGKKKRIYYQINPHHRTFSYCAHVRRCDISGIYPGITQPTAAARQTLSCIRTQTTKAAARQTANDSHDGHEELVFKHSSITTLCCTLVVVACGS